MPSRRLLLLGLLLPALLGACGYHLRGEPRDLSRYSPLFIDTEDLSAADLALLRAELERAGARVVEPGQAAHRLWIELSPVQRRSLADSGLSTISLWRVGMSLDFGLDGADGSPLLPRQSLTESDRVELDNDNPLMARSRLEQAEWRLRQALIRRLVLRLGLS